MLFVGNLGAPCRKYSCIWEIIWQGEQNTKAFSKQCSLDEVTQNLETNLVQIEGVLRI